MQKLYTSAKVVVWMNRLKELRASKGMRQADLSKLLNVQPTTISNYELGVREEELLLSWRRATPEIRAIIDAALAPYREEAAPGIASAPTA